MEKHSSSHSHSDTATHVRSHNKVAAQFPADIAEDYKEKSEYARRKFIPAIERARANDDAQEKFSSSATNLATGGLILAQLALIINARVAEM